MDKCFAHSLLVLIDCRGTVKILCPSRCCLETRMCCNYVAYVTRNFLSCVESWPPISDWITFVQIVLGAQQTHEVHIFYSLYVDVIG